MGNRAIAWLQHLANAWCRHEQWNIGIVRAPIQSFLSRHELPEVDWLPIPPRGAYRADPFGWRWGDRLIILYELFEQRAARGFICALEIEGDRVVDRKEYPMRFPCHASYPYLFEHKGEIYCVPETKRLNGFDLFRYDRESGNWRLVRRLIDGFSGVDPTILEHEGRWYLICGGGTADRDHDLFIWYADDPTGDWWPHAMSPAKHGDQRSRPGGTPFRHEGALYRPAQDGTKTYGGKVVIYRIDRLTPQTFEEREVTSVGPRPGDRFAAGCHTLTAVGDWTLVDGKRYLFSPGAFGHRFASSTGLRRFLQAAGWV